MKIARTKIEVQMVIEKKEPEFLTWYEAFLNQEPVEIPETVLNDMFLFKIMSWYYVYTEQGGFAEVILTNN